MKITWERLKELLHYDPETGIFVWKVGNRVRVKAGDVAGCVDNNGYVIIRVNGKNNYAHRLAFLYMTGEYPKGHVDHINALDEDVFTNRSDNRWCNLRDGTCRGNISNQKMHRNGHLVGTSFHKVSGKWQSSIGIKRKAKYLGLYDTDVEASDVYQKALKGLYETT